MTFSRVTPVFGTGGANPATGADFIELLFTAIPVRRWAFLSQVADRTAPIGDARARQPTIASWRIHKLCRQTGHNNPLNPYGDALRREVYPTNSRIRIK